MQRCNWRRTARHIICLLTLGLVLFTGFAAVTFTHPSVAMAQEAGAGEGESKPQAQSFLVWFYEALGILYVVPFTIMSFSLVALVVMNMLSFRRDAICPPHLVATFDSYLTEKKYQEAYDLAKNDESFLAQMLAAGLAKLSVGYDHAVEAMQQVGEEENMKLEHRLSYVSLIGTLSPMLGLLGTVDGMVRSFSVIQLSGTSPKPQELAKGISTALVTTIVGLWIALPAIFAYNTLKNVLQRRILEVGVHSENLMERFESMGPKK